MITRGLIRTEQKLTAKKTVFNETMEIFMMIRNLDNNEIVKLDHIPE